MYMVKRNLMFYDILILNGCKYYKYTKVFLNVKEQRINFSELVQISCYEIWNLIKEHSKLRKIRKSKIWLQLKYNATKLPKFF